MQIALLGGTGDLGEGLALRLAPTDAAVTVGSRDPDRAADRATAYEQTLAEHGTPASITGAANPAAAADADLVVLAVPAYHLADTIETVANQLGDAILVSPAVGMQGTDTGLSYNPPGIGSVTELAAASAPDETPVIGAFHNLAAGRLATLDAELGWDVPVVGNDPNAKQAVLELLASVEGLHGLDAGGLANAAEIEALTPLLINLAANNERLHNLGVSFH
ncbi:MAG: NADPH-dependent F420 reductase [halophilic archaeon J07HX5]|jgi:reduced coenzyme F420:NADP oxidoreductase (EC 1.6.99.-)|nr:MAG: NADPH-dependent F420 reductase [halophilic archaeon J07HX5]